MNLTNASSGSAFPKSKGSPRYVGNRETKILHALSRGWSFDPIEALFLFGDPWLPATLEHLNDSYGVLARKYVSGRYGCDSTGRERAREALEEIGGLDK